jgi:hypothetical protein
MVGDLPVRVSLAGVMLLLLLLLLVLVVLVLVVADTVA